METYYFIEQNGLKEGPLKFDELKLKVIKPSDLVWRNDKENWQEASTMDELQDYVFVHPPPTPKEINKSVSSEKIKSQVAIATVVYLILSFLISAFATSTAESSWKEYNAKHNAAIESFDYSNTSIYDRYHRVFYERGMDLENVYGLSQSIWFRSFKAFFSTVYLTQVEREDSTALMLNMAASSFLSLLPILLLVVALIYIANFSAKHA